MSDLTGTDWVTTEIEVKIRETHDDPGLIHQIGIIRNINVSSVRWLVNE